MQAKTDMYEASKFLGMTVRTLEQTYGRLNTWGTRRMSAVVKDIRKSLYVSTQFATATREPSANKTPRNVLKHREISM
jgi:hypothetical protein